MKHVDCTLRAILCLKEGEKMENMTLRELCQKLGVTRRAVQGYEKKGLVSATSKNKYGYLIYDDEARKRILQIKMYQKIGFSLQEISELIDASNDWKVEALECQLIVLKTQERELNKIIVETKKLIKKLKDT